MAERDRIEGCRRSLDTGQILELLGFKPLLDSAQPVRTLRMAGWGKVIEASGMRNDKRGHCQHLVVWRAKRKCRAWLRQRCGGIVDAAGAIDHFAFEPSRYGRQMFGKKSRDGNARGRSVI